MKNKLETLLVLVFLFTNLYTIQLPAQVLNNNKTLFVELFATNIFNVDEAPLGDYEREDQLLDYAVLNNYEILILNRFSIFTELFPKKIIITATPTGTALISENNIARFLNKAHDRGINLIGFQAGAHYLISNVPYRTNIFDNVNEYNKRRMSIGGADECFDLIYTEEDWWGLQGLSGNPLINWTNYYFPTLNHMFQNVKLASQQPGAHPLIVATYIDYINSIINIPNYRAEDIANLLDENTDLIYLCMYMRGDWIDNQTPVKFFERDFVRGKRLELFSKNVKSTKLIPFFSAESSKDVDRNFFGDNIINENNIFFDPIQTEDHHTVDGIKDQFNNWYTTINDPYSTLSLPQLNMTMEEICETNSSGLANDMSKGIGWFKYSCMPDVKFLVRLPDDNSNVTTCTYIISPDHIIDNQFHVNNVYDMNPSILPDITEYNWYKNGTLQAMSTSDYDAPAVTIESGIEDIWSCEIIVHVRPTGQTGYFNYLKFRDDIKLKGVVPTVNITTANSAICANQQITQMRRIYKTVRT